MEGEMFTHFMSFLEPPRKALSGYDATRPHNEQYSPYIPATFLHAMSVREKVFVNEQHVPLTNEFDDDDARSFHWVIYASISANAGPWDRHRPMTAVAIRAHQDGTADNLPIGTIRLVPPRRPRAPWMDAERVDSDDEEVGKAPSSGGSPNSGTMSSFNPRGEPYIKIGRLAILPAYRKLGLARLLMKTALDWASAHPTDILTPRLPSEIEIAKFQGVYNNTWEPWTGLVLIHAQKEIEEIYIKWGFEKDIYMGEWDEEGIIHVGMSRRIRLAEFRWKVVTDGSWFRYWEPKWRGPRRIGQLGYQPHLDEQK